MFKFLKSLPFHIKSAYKSLIRHFVMTLSASSAVMVTLVLLAAFLMIAGNVSGFADNIEEDIRIHVVLTKEVETQEQIDDARKDIEAISGVKKAEFSSKENELNLWVLEKGEIFSIYEGEDNPLHHAFFVSVNDSSQIASITEQITKLKSVDTAMYGGNSISQLIDMLNTIRTGIAAFMALIAVLAIFLISNTIKMAIYARANEIAIMRNVGATDLFIRTPFMIEGVFIGLIGSILPCLLAYYGYEYLYEMMGGQLFSVVFSLQPLTPFIYEILGVLVIGGVLVGLLGSLISANRYLRWKR